MAQYSISSINQEMNDKARNIEDIVREVQVGEIYEGKVKNVLRNSVLSLN